MKHTIKEDVNVNANVNIPTDELESLVDHIVDGAVTIIVVATAAHIFRRWVT
jgi:hypothetical protein